MDMHRVNTAPGQRRTEDNSHVAEGPKSEVTSDVKAKRRTKRVVHMSSVHPPYDTRIFLKECRTLVKAGYEVTYVVAMEADAEREGVKFVTVPASNGYLGRMFKTSRAVYRSALRLNADMYHFHDPELVPWALLLRLRGKKVIMDVHENTTRDIMIKEWIPKAVRPILAFCFGALERVGAASFNGIVAAFPGVLDELPKKKTVLAGNLPILGELNTPSSIPFNQRPRRAAYVGQMTEIRGIFELLAGLAALPKDFDFELHIAGQFLPESLLDEAKTKPGFERMKVLGQISRSDVADLLSSVRFGVVFFQNVASHTRSLPTKLFEYASAGLPTLGPDMAHWVEFIKEDAMGFCVDITNPAAIAERLMFMTDHPDECQEIGAHAREAVESRYNWDIEGARLIELYDRILLN